ncbi:kinesin family member 27 isoform 3-like protein [Camelus ferus]|nr:kinesin family member 27 isoform 3-like protein [Camelus ferus]
MDGLLTPRESAKFIAENSRDVFIDGGGVRRVAELLLAKAAGPELRVGGWKALHELNPRAADEAAVNWVFVIDTLNFSFWSEHDEHKSLVGYRGKTYSGYWSLCAAVNRALDEGIPITSASYYATVTLDQVRHILRSDTDVPMPLIEERHRILNETGRILLEKFEGSFLNCVRKSEKSAQKLMHLVVESFPSYRDVTQFEGKRISFYKRAQILVADTWSVLEGKGDGCFKDISSITMFADYRLPQVLVYLGALKYSDELLEKLLKGEMLSYGSRQEVEIRGCSLWCVELIRDCLLELIEEKGEKSSDEINSILLDYYLWDYARDHRNASIVEGQKGIIPRAIQEIFQNISENPSIDFNVKVSYIEVYKEDLRDLLELETSVKDLHIREDEKGNTVIVGAKECQVESADEVLSLLEMGNAARHTGTTQMNEHSSRSHAIFTISVCQVKKNIEAAEDGSWYSHRHIVSKFHFVDLAGSERVTKTGNTGERFKESIQINSGLLALGNVISALGDPRRKSSHIPYRDAKITRLLKDSLGGSAKTLMITCVSPSSSDFDESLNSLKYANRARNIRNKPTLNFSPESDRMDEMEFEIKLLREALQSQQSVSSQTSQMHREETPDKNKIHSLEEQVAQLQGECLGYQNCIEEAFTFLVDLKDAVKLNQKQQHRLQEWFNTTQEIRKAILTSFRGSQGVGNLEEGPQHITVLQLKRELKKCQCALAADEVVFNQKDLEVKELKNQVQMMVQENKGHVVSLKEAQKVNRLQVHTSPSVYSLDRLVAGFRTRSQMLLGHIEEQDEVLHCQFSDNSDDEESESQEKSEIRVRKCQIAEYLRAMKNCVSESTGNDAKSVSKQYSLKVTKLEQEAEQAKVELTETEKQLQELENRDLSDIALKVKLQKEFRKKMDAAKLRVQELQLKTEQKEGLKLKAEDLDAFKMRRKGPFGSVDQLQKLDEQKKWLDEEVEKVLNQRQELEMLEEDLKKREAIVSKKEALLQEKSHLENKKLRSSQALNTDSLKIATRLNLLDQELSEKNVQLQSSTSEEKIKISEQVQALQKEKDQLQRRRDSVDEKLKNGSMLSPEEEHVLFQLEEGIEALEAAIEYKNEGIQSRQKSLRASFQNLSHSEANVLEKLICLNPVEIRAILLRYFNKVVNLREAERKLQLQNEEIKMKVLERDNTVRELESALEHLKLQCDRRLTLQQKEHEQKMQLLLHHFKEQDGEGIVETLKNYEDKIQQLERDLYFYKKTSRDLKKKLKELLGEAIRRQLAPSENHDAGDRVQNPDKAGVVSEESKWVSRTESMKLSGRERELDSSTSSLRTQPNPQKLWEDGPELPPIYSSLAPTSGHLLSNEDKTETDENQFTKSHSRSSPHIQPVGNVGQLHGVTPVKLCRKELRQISTFELSLRRSSLGVGSMTADSIEVARKPSDLKT